MSKRERKFQVRDSPAVRNGRYKDVGILLIQCYVAWTGISSARSISFSYGLGYGLSLYQLGGRQNSQSLAFFKCLIICFCKDLQPRCSFQGQGTTTMNKSGDKKIRVGIIGANPDRGWAAEAHIPALKSLSDDFEITVKVPYHLELATAALNAGKAVYCEWPLGNGLKEAETLAALAKEKGVLAVVGLQARSAPAIAYVRQLITEGYVGDVLSTTLVGSGMGWGPAVEPSNVYMNDKKNGATMLSIGLGHAADSLCHCLGEVRELSATMAMRRTSFTVSGTGERKPMAAEDQVAVNGSLEGGAAFSIHYRGGSSRGINLLWEINGTEGDLQLTADGGQAQIFELTVRGAKGAQSALEILRVPEEYRWAPPQPGPGTNVAQAYARFARDYREGTHLSPTFEDAVTRHRMLNAIEIAAATGERQRLS